MITAIYAARLGMKSPVLSALGDSAVARLKRERVSVTNLRKPNQPHAITAEATLEAAMPHAGDRFNAGFLVAWLRGKSPAQCLAAGNKVAAASGM